MGGGRRGIVYPRFVLGFGLVGFGAGGVLGDQTRGGGGGEGKEGRGGDGGEGMANGCRDLGSWNLLLQIRGGQR